MTHRGGLSLSIIIWRIGGGGGANFLSPWGPKFSWWTCMYILVCTSKQGYIGKWTCENIEHYTYTIVWNCVFIAVLHNKGGHGNNIVWKLCAWCHTHYKQYGYNKAILCSVLSLPIYPCLLVQTSMYIQVHQENFGPQGERKFAPPLLQFSK
jgi:hypothetical protein